MDLVVRRIVDFFHSSVLDYFRIKNQSPQNRNRKHKLQQEGKFDPWGDRMRGLTTDEHIATPPSPPDGMSEEETQAYSKEAFPTYIVENMEHCGWRPDNNDANQITEYRKGGKQNIQNAAQNQRQSPKEKK